MSSFFVCNLFTIVLFLSEKFYLTAQLQRSNERYAQNFALLFLALRPNTYSADHNFHTESSLRYYLPLLLRSPFILHVFFLPQKYLSHSEIGKIEGEDDLWELRKSDFALLACHSGNPNPASKHRQPLPIPTYSPSKLAISAIFRSPSRDLQILKSTPGIDSSLKNRGYMSFFQHSRTNSSCIYHDFLQKISFFWRQNWLEFTKIT